MNIETNLSKWNSRTLCVNAIGNKTLLLQTNSFRDTQMKDFSNELKII